ncbi:VOC family protein [Aeromicrobium stalagmiti]|uniref:VOC family protein n=1 Tax=Aeromicrobium stalagmiti TaxID=2738988 RepID=UPI001569B784|nr:VOC family protein [Aeromicrobium stalagmiti]NRQ48421.1 VOC family protein [Aeromicrobium stalagmiti]
MTAHLHAMSFGANEPHELAHFWAGVLRRELGEDGVTVLPGEATDFPVRFVEQPGDKTGPNQMHFDLTSNWPGDQKVTVARVLELGGRHLDIGQGPDDTHVVMADPEGNELCVIAAGNNFLADTAFIGALSSDGTQAVGYFWSKALGWPLVWDQDEETAIQSLQGGSKISWGGPPVNSKTGRNRLQLDLVPAAGSGQGAEVDRLVALGATRVTTRKDGAVDMLDPDGNEFAVVPQ